MATKNTKSTNQENTVSTTIRINKSTKEKIENLDFVKKHTFDEILTVLINFYEKRKNKV
jgi:hypothetical protein